MRYGASMTWIRVTNEADATEKWVNIDAICNIKISVLTPTDEMLVVLELANGAGIDVKMTKEALTDFRKLIGIDQKGKK